MLNPPGACHALLAQLAQRLGGSGLSADALVLLAGSAADVCAWSTSGADLLADSLQALLPGRQQVLVLPPLPGGACPPQLLAQLARGRQVFTVDHAPWWQQLQAQMPARQLLAVGERHFLRLAAPPAAEAAAPGAAAADFAMYCKTYRHDLARAQVLVDSWRRHNRDGLTLYLSCPADDLPLFAPLAGDGVRLLADESYAGPALTDQGFAGMSAGYVNQQICKLTFYRAGLAHNYLCLDADTVFIRDFRVDDFMHSPGVPYTVLVMDKDLSIERHYRDVHWLGRQAMVADIYRHVGLDDRRLRTCHNAQVFNAGVLHTLEQVFMRQKGWRHVDLLRHGSYEFSWYNAWFQKCRQVPEVAVEPFFKMLHMRPEYIFSRLRMLRESDYAQAYVGLILNSKWRPATPLRYEDPSPAHARLYQTLLQDEAWVERLAG